MGIGNPFKNVEKKIRKGIEDLGKSTRDGIWRLGRDTEGKIRGVGGQVEGNVKSLGHQVEDGVKRVADEAEHNIKSAADELKNEIDEYTDKAIEELEDEAQEVLNKIFESITKESLETALEVAKKAESITETALADASFGIDISVVGFGWSDVGGRMGDIRHKIEGLIKEKPEISRDYIIQCINMLAPDTVSFSIDVQLAALVVSSEAVGVGFNFTLNTQSFLAAADELLEAIGL